MVDSGFSDTDWTDDEIVINPGGNNFWYYAKAYTHYSPDSDPSSLAKIKGNPSKPLTKEPEHNNIIRQNILKLHLTTFPNPLNSNTIIHFTIPRDGHVRLVIYNIYGQRVVSCVDRSQHAGTYQYNLDSSNLAGGFYLARLQFNNQSLCRKILLLK